MVGSDTFAAVRETHVSTVFFVGDRVYKLKKPVKLDFLDYSTIEQRRRICEREVLLNRRLAPDVYLGVADVHGPDGELCDHLVVMRRMPEDRRLSSLVERGDGVDDCVRAVARTVAVFHAQAETSPEITSAATVDRVRANWQSNFDTMEPFLGSVLDVEVATAVKRLAGRYLDGRSALFATRIAQGKVRDGHGDLLADDIFCLDDGPRILDCIEFDDRLRFGDVLGDVAFLAMDLERAGDPGLAARFLGWYRELAGETYPETLARHYVAYRSHVRAKVSCIRAGQGDPSAAEAADQLLRMTRDHLERGRVVLTLVGGLPGTGKSTLANDLADRLGWTVLHSDEVRKDLAGVGHISHTGRTRRDAFGEGLYRAQMTARTYRTLVERARALLEHGEPVILDASWNAGEWRDLARDVARETASELRELRCHAPTGVVAARLQRRARTATDASDATIDTAVRMAAVTEPWPEATTIDTSPQRATVLSAGYAAVM